MDLKRNFVFFLTCILISSLDCGAVANDNLLIGLWYRNFTNDQGALADGTCCDNVGLRAPNCPKDQCDTSFSPCGTFVGGNKCGAYPDSATATKEDTDSFVLGRHIVNAKTGKQSPTLVAIVVPFRTDNIEFYIEARENTGNHTALMAKFSFLVDWIDPFFSKDLHWRSFILTNASSELGIDVVRQCARHYFGPKCSVYCRPTHQYACLNDGSKNCTAGWQGLDCDQLVPYCTTGLCQHGGSCTNIHLGYICSCLPAYSGKNCETILPWSNASKTATVISGLASPSLLNSSGKIRTTLTTKNDPNAENTSLIVGTSVSAGLILLGLLAATGYVVYRIKIQKKREMVEPAPTPPVSLTETL